jgi:hypothetical protein
MEKSMRLIALILAFACYTDAQAQNTVVHDTDGRYWVLQSSTVTTIPNGAVAGTYKVEGLGGVFAYATGCPLGRGYISLKVLGLDESVPYMDKRWSYNKSGVYDHLAIALCAGGLSK